MKAVVEKVRKYYKYGTTPNVTVVGSPTINSGVMSGFNTSNYAILGESILTALSTANSFEIVFKFTTGSDVSTIQFIFYQGVSRMALGYNGIGLQVRGDIASYPVINWGYAYSNSQQGIAGSNRVYPNTTYWAKMEFSGTLINIYISTDGENWLLDGSLTTSTKLQASSYNATMGCSVENNASPIYTFFGSIDFKESYIKINGADWWHGTLAEEATPSDYDFYKDTYTYSLIKQNNTYKAIKSYEKGQYYGN